MAVTLRSSEHEFPPFSAAKLRNTTCGKGARIRETLAGGAETTTVIARLRCTGG